MKHKRTLREIGEELIALHDAHDLIDVVDLIEIGREIVNFTGYTFDSYRRLREEEK